MGGPSSLETQAGLGYTRSIQGVDLLPWAAPITATSTPKLKESKGTSPLRNFFRHDVWGMYLLHAFSSTYRGLGRAVWLTDFVPPLLSRMMQIACRVSCIIINHIGGTIQEDREGIHHWQPFQRLRFRGQ
jgi:hypothetical protein